MSKIRFLSFCLGLAFVLAVSPALAGDADRGKKLYGAKCKACHSINAGNHKMGPSLSGIFGKKAGATEYKRYRGLKGSTIVWNEANLDKFLADPRKFIGKKSGMKSRLMGADNRADVIDYLKTLK